MWASITHKIQEGLWINVYPNQESFYLSLQLPSGKVVPVSPKEAGYKDIPKIDTMDKLRDLANRLRKEAKE